MACFIKIPFTGEAGHLLEKAKLAMTEAGGTLTGDETQGSFTVPSPAGKISAEYNISDHQLQIAISKKPFILSCRRIEEFLNSNLE